ncbi:hypothetical protein [Stutzerimonas stutzeri]|uniref:Lipoprotein n=1 Tax=Stutzerimonas stutzeri TaxID=316 RepID=A0A6I6LGZ5_STUST|nr:hypothetical protein [Stutzerimonas stutzeri]QGZ29638.1 hypothetical protein GQA94_05970 [Stutzerimonas stutzeri]
MTHLYRLLLAPVLCLLIVGCTSKPIYNAQEQFAADMQLSDRQMQRAIVTALNDRQWKVQSLQPGMVKAAITVRARHHAEVDIPYTSTSFQINYRSSWGLDQKNGKIHRNYNRWVNRLRDNILKELDVNPIIESVDHLGIIEQGSGNGDVAYFDFASGIQRGLDSGTLDGSVTFHLDGSPVTGEVHRMRSVTSSRKTNASNKSDQQACDWALQSALAALQNAAKQAGANAVVDIVSYHKRDVHRDATRYECRAGTLIAAVALRGQLATVK